MAEENEKKPGFVVHKKQQDAAPAATTEKKKVVVVKKKAAANPQTNTQTQNQANTSGAKHVVVKKADNAAPAQHKAEAKPAAAKTEGAKARTFELNSARPNVKAGNLSDKPRQGGFNRDRKCGLCEHNRQRALRCERRLVPLQAVSRDLFKGDEHPLLCVYGACGAVRGRHLRADQQVHGQGKARKGESAADGCFDAFRRVPVRRKGQMIDPQESTQTVSKNLPVSWEGFFHPGSVGPAFRKSNRARFRPEYTL